MGKAATAAVAGDEDAAGIEIQLRRQTLEQNESLLKALPALERIVQQATASLSRPGLPPSSGAAALFNASAEPEKARELHEKLQAWRQEIDAPLPTKNTPVADAQQPKAGKKGKKNRRGQGKRAAKQAAAAAAE